MTQIKELQQIRVAIREIKKKKILATISSA